jgi:hypothetical protein
MKRIDIVKRDNQWIGESNRVVVAKASTKEAAIKATAAVAKADSNAVTVKIHNINGKIQEERTCPRSADPTRSKG